MKKYNDNDVVVNGFYGVDISVEEVVKILWEDSGDNLDWNVEDEVKKWKKSFEGGKKYVIRGCIGSRGYYEGLEIIREGEVMYEKDLMYGSDYWILRESMLEDLEKEYKEGGYWSKEEYEGEVELWKEGSNREISMDKLFGCINGDGVEYNEEEGYYYFVVNRLNNE
jgi:hypothetical protein